MRNIIYLLFLLFLLPKTSTAQDSVYAKKIVNILASPEMKGRGYVQNGDQVAAKFIRDEFERIGLNPFGKKYLQKFNLSVNTFPGQMELTINDKQLVPGADFLVDPGSPGISGTYKTVELKISDLLDENRFVDKLRNATGKILVVQPYTKNDYTKDEQKQIGDFLNFLKYHPDNPAAGTVVLTTDKLTWSVSTVQYEKPSFIIKVNDPDISIEQISIAVESEFIKKYKSQNVIGFIEGDVTDSLLVFSGHYDHLGMMGMETIFPGANDNASGIAMLLNLAKHYKANKPEYTTVFIAFGAEEAGLLGSKHFVENPAFDLDKIKFLINFDIAGTGDDGIQVVNGSVYKEKFDRMKKLNEEKALLPLVKIRGEACNSDHCMFHMQGVPCFFIYTLGGIQAYHDIYDKAETLPLTEFEDYFTLITCFVRGL